MIKALPTSQVSQTIDELLMYFSTLKIKNQSNLQHSLEALTYSLVSTYDFDRCGIWLFDESQTLLTCKNLYSRISGTFSAGQQIILSAFPDYFEAIKSNRVVTIGNAQESELTRTFFHRYLKDKNINSILNLGLWDNGDLIGVISLADSINNREFDHSHCLSLIPFADLSSNWLNQSHDSLKLKKKYNFNNEALLREVSYLCKKSESVSLSALLKKALKSFSTLLGDSNCHAIVFNQLQAELYSSNKKLQDQKLDVIQANNLHNIAKDTKVLWIPDSKSLAIGLPSYLKRIISNANCSVAILSSTNKTKNSLFGFILVIEFPNKNTAIEKEVQYALDQISTAFSIVLEHADTKSILKESLGLAKGAFDGSNIGMAVFDSFSRLIRVNKSLKAIAEEEISLISTLIPESISNNSLHENASEEKTYKGTKEMILPSGEIKYLYIDISKIQFDNSNLSFFLLQVLDFTEQKKAITALEEQESLFKNVIDLNPAFIFAKSLDGTFVLANESVSEVYGTTPDKMVGKKDSDFNNDPVEVNKFKEDDTRVILGKKEIFIPEEKITDSKGNVRYLQTVKKPILNPHDGKYLVLGVSTDITEIKTSEARERKWLQEIEHTQKLESLGLLAGGIAHDFNNLLQAILGNCSLSLRTVKEGSETSNYLHKVLLAGEKASALCNQLLCYSKNKPISKSPIDMNELVRDCSYIFERIISKDVQIIYSIENNLPLILGDKAQIEQVIMNLVTNAIEAANEGGHTVSIKTSIETTAGNNLILEVQDNGPGISEENRKKIFEPFFTTKLQGRGLGLSAVKGIIENHLGSIEISSTIRVGTTFKVRLPITEQLSQNVETKDVINPTNIDLTGKTIVLIDDEMLSREVSSEMLFISGASSITFDNALSALCRLKDKSLIVDMVILDLNMPLMSGDEAFQKIRSMRPDVPILIISGYSDLMNIEKLLSHPKTCYLAKPYCYENLVLSIYGCLNLNGK